MNYCPILMVSLSALIVFFVLAIADSVPHLWLGGVTGLLMVIGVRAGMGEVTKKQEWLFFAAVCLVALLTATIRVLA